MTDFTLLPFVYIEGGLTPGVYSGVSLAVDTYKVHPENISSFNIFNQPAVQPEEDLWLGGTEWSKRSS